MRRQQAMHRRPSRCAKQQQVTGDANQACVLQQLVRLGAAAAGLGIPGPYWPTYLGPRSGARGGPGAANSKQARGLSSCTMQTRGQQKLALLAPACSPRASEVAHGAVKALQHSKKARGVRCKAQE